MTTEYSPFNTLVVGAGAVGSLYGGKLQQAGARVSIVCRSDHDIACERGIQVKSCWGDFVLKPENVYRHCSEVPDPPDILLVALKVLPELDRPALIRDAVGPKTTIVLLQNGVEIEEEVARTFPKNNIISGLAFVCCNRIGPGSFHHMDYGCLKLGDFPGGIKPLTRQLADLWKHVDVPVELKEDIVRARWWKLVWNAPFNPMSVLAGGATTAELLGDPVSAANVRSVMEEVCALAEAAGHPLEPDVVDQMLEATQNMTPYKTSMLLDLEAGRPMEVEAILGNAVRAGERLGVDVPHISSLYGLLRLVDANAKCVGNVRRPEPES